MAARQEIEPVPGVAVEPPAPWSVRRGAEAIPDEVAADRGGGGDGGGMLPAHSGWRGPLTGRAS